MVLDVAKLGSLTVKELKAELENRGVDTSKVNKTCINTILY